jgi:hypothetical protein
MLNSLKKLVFLREEPQIDRLKFFWLDLGGLELRQPAPGLFARDLIRQITQNVFAGIERCGRMYLQVHIHVEPAKSGFHRKVAIHQAGHFDLLLFKVWEPFAML